MNNLDSVFHRYGYNPFIQYPDQAEIKEKQEADVKENLLPFNIIKTALANLNSGVILTQAELREKTIQVLTDLSNGDVSILDQLPDIKNVTSFYKSLFKLTSMYKKIELIHASLDRDDDERDSQLKSVCQELVKLGDIDKAIEIAKTTRIKEAVMGELCSSLIKENRLDQAIRLMNLIEDEIFRTKIFKKISIAFVANGSVERALALCNSIPETHTRGAFLLAISKALKMRGEIEKATIVANMAKNTMDLAIHYAHFIPDDSLKGSVFSNIVKIFIKVGNIEMAINIADNICNLESRDNAYSHIVRYYGKIGNIEQVTMFVDKIIDEYVSSWVLLIMVNRSFYNEDTIASLVSFAFQIKISVLREEALTNIINGVFLEANYTLFMKVIKVVEGETNATIKRNLEKLVSDILKKISMGG